MTHNDQKWVILFNSMFYSTSVFYMDVIYSEARIYFFAHIGIKSKTSCNMVSKKKIQYIQNLY